MQLNNTDVYNFLVEQDINFLYHANTVSTACTFIKEGGLLSRGEVERRGLFQTPQSSDDIDKEFHVWHDLFLDSVDLHGNFPRQNFYGPVLFKLDIDVLKYPQLPELHVTKDNPIRWNRNMDHEDMYFQSIEQFRMVYRNGSYKEMLTLKNSKTPLPFEDYLVDIIVDNPNVAIDGKPLYKIALNSLSQAITASDFNYSHVDLITRQDCKPPCYCKYNYRNQFNSAELKALFS